MTVTTSESAWWRREPAVPASDESTEGAVPFVALIVFTSILLLSPQTFIPVLKPFRIAFVAAGIAAVTLLWERRTGQNALGVNREIAICFALLAWAFVTIPLSLWPGGSVARLTDVYIKSVIVFWLLANVIKSKRQLTVLRTVLMICCVPLALMAVKNYLNGTFIADAGGVSRIVSYEAALSSNPNDLALLLNLLLPLSIAQLLSARTLWVRLLSVAVIGMTVLAIIITFSRAGFLGLATICGMYFLRMMRRPGRDRSWAFALLFAGVLMLPMIPETYVARLATVKSVSSDPTGSAQARWRDIVAASQYVVEHPVVGAGIGMDILALNAVRGAEWCQVHNVYLEYAVDLGLGGALLFLAMFFGVFAGVRKSRKSLAGEPEQRDLFLIAEALETSLIVFAICGVFYPIAYHFFFYYIGGLALAARSVTLQLVSPARA
jgi:O-antigen ligase